ELIDVLSPFYSATLLLSSSNYSTIGEFHFTLWTLVKNLHKQIEVGNTQYIVANSIFTTDEITRTVTAIKRKLIHYNSSLNINNNNASTITTNNQTSPSQIIKNRIDARAHIRSLASSGAKVSGEIQLFFPIPNLKLTSPNIKISEISEAM
ncbi:14947_t:CDS:2, partial [Entrophospora sp. SA101]